MNRFTKNMGVDHVDRLLTIRVGVRGTVPGEGVGMKVEYDVHSLSCVIINVYFVGVFFTAFEVNNFQ